jgi:hypothetical protein
VIANAIEVERGGYREGRDVNAFKGFSCEREKSCE